MKKILTALFLSFLYCLPTFAQVGEFQRNDTSDLTSPVQYKTYWRDATKGVYRVYSGVNGYQPAGFGFSNWFASIDPTSSNDSTQGYEPGSLWYNVNSKTFFFCPDATASNAVWCQITSAANPNLSELLRYPDFFADCLVSGCNSTVPGSPSLALTTPAGIAYASGTRTVVPNTTFTYLASSDTYDFVEADGTIFHSAQVLGAGAPTGINGLLLQKVTTDGTQITAVTLLAASKPTFTVGPATPGTSQVLPINQADTRYVPLTFTTQNINANKFYSGPASGAPAPANFRNLVLADFAAFNFLQADVAFGSMSPGDLFYVPSSGTNLARLSVGANPDGSFLQLASHLPVWGPPPTSGGGGGGGAPGFGGSGADGALTLSSNTIETNSFKQYNLTNLTVNSSVTYKTIHHANIQCTGTATINGTLTVQNGVGCAAGNGGFQYGLFGSSVCGGGGGSCININDGLGDDTSGLQGGSGGTDPGGTISPGPIPLGGSIKDLEGGAGGGYGMPALSSPPGGTVTIAAVGLITVNGTIDTSANGSAIGSNGEGGGSGGVCVLASQTGVTLGGSSVLISNGQPGAPGNASSGGGGGGASGCYILWAPTVAGTAATQIFNGGAGGSGTSGSATNGNSGASSGNNIIQITGTPTTPYFAEVIEQAIKIAHRTGRYKFTAKELLKSLKHAA